jgi:hypothetical protein
MIAELASTVVGGSGGVGGLLGGKSGSSSSATSSASGNSLTTGAMESAAGVPVWVVGLCVLVIAALWIRRR